MLMDDDVLCMVLMTYICMVVFREERQKFETEKNAKQEELNKMRGDVSPCYLPTYLTTCLHTYTHQATYLPRQQLDGARRDFKDKEVLLDKTNKELVDARTKITALMIVQEGRQVGRQVV